MFPAILSILFISLGILFLVYQKTESIRLRTLCLFLAVLSCIIMGLNFAYMLIDMSGSSSALFKKQKEYMEFGAKYLIRYLGQTKADHQCTNILILTFPQNCSYPRAPMAKFILEGLEKAAGSAGMKIVGVEEARSAEKGDYWLVASEFDRAIKSHPEAELVISLVGLPIDVENIGFWYQENCPQLILFGGNLKYMDIALKHKIVIAAIAFVPGASFANSRKPTDQNAEETFYEHFLLINRSNIDETKQVFPALFK